MEEKSFFKRYSSFWPVFNIGSNSKFIFGKRYFLLSINPPWNLVKFNKYSFGFTLIELLVVIAMVGIMISFLFLFLNPFKQIEKSRDAQRQQNLKQITSALDTYYNDSNCYPLSLSFGSSWQPYMQKIPQDPSCQGGGPCYTYVIDSSICPQWNVLFAKIYQASVNTGTCALESNCLPSNYNQSGYNYCVLSGSVDCAYLSTYSFP